MQSHVPTTPFGRRPMTLGLIASQLSAKEMPKEAVAHKWHVFQNIREARELIGTTDRALAILNALLSFHPETVLTADGSLIVWPSNGHLMARANGMSLATLRRHISNLVLRGLVIRRDSPNGKRYARRGQGGSIEQAFGFDLSPLVARAEEFKELAEAVKAEKQAYKVARERLTICRRDVVKLIESGVEEGVPGDWRGFRSRYDQILIDLPRTATRQTLDSVTLELERLRDEARNILESFIKVQDIRPSESHSDPHIQNSNPELSYEIERGFREKDEASGNAAETDNVRSLPKRELTLGIVLDACPDMRELGSGGEIRTWRDLAAAAEIARPMLGISPSAWEEAWGVLGPENAAITVGAILQKAEQIANPGGYLRSLTERAKDGKFSPWPMVMALLRARMKDRKTEASGNVRRFEGSPGDDFAEKSPRLEVSDALRQMMTRKGWDR